MAERFDGPDIAISSLQPIVNWSLGNGWAIGGSEMNFIYDWNEGAFTSLPLGAKLSKLTRIGGKPVQFQISYEHNFYDKGVVPEDTIGISIKMLVPAG